MILQYAIKANAAAVILAHNHPSGNLGASDADKRITGNVREALKLVDIELLDHPILTYEESLLERGKSKQMKQKKTNLTLKK